jgi:hypothetical protein
MKKITLILIAWTTIASSMSAQSAGDYRSISDGNWNDITKWQTYDGTNWIGAASYPGQDPGTGEVTILSGVEITLTATVPQPIASLKILASPTPDNQVAYPMGKLSFSSSNQISLTVAGSVTVSGGLIVGDQNGAKNHSLSVGGSMIFGSTIYVADSTCDPEISEYCPPFEYIFPAFFRPIDNDDNLVVKFNTTIPNSSITGAGGIGFQDVIFDGIGISVNSEITISGNANFINGIVSSPIYVSFDDGATVSGGSNASFVEGRTWKRGDDPFTFPIGSNGIYSPLRISAPANVNDVFSAYYVTSANIDPAVTSDTGLYSVSNCEYWLLNPGYGNFGILDTTYNGYIDVTVGWTPYNVCGSSNISKVADVTLARSVNQWFFTQQGTWDSHGGSGVGTSTNGSVTSRGLNKFGAFTLGNINANCIIPYGLTVTNITTTSATLSWSPVVGAVSYDVSYKQENYPYSTITASVNTSATSISGLNPLSIFDWKVRANCGSSSSAYRVGPQFSTLNPCTAPTGLSATNITPSSATLSWAPVQNGSNYNVQYKPSTSDSWINATVISSSSCNINGLLPATTYDWRVTASCYIGSYYGYGSATAQSSFTTPACSDIYESNNTSSAAKAISLGASIFASISPASDVDWFKVTMPNNSNTTLQATLSNLPADYDLFVYNRNLSLVASSTNVGTANESVTYGSHVRSATYYIKVAAKNGTFSINQCYSLLAQAVGGSVTAVANTNERTSFEDDELLYPNPASAFVHLRFNSSIEGPSDVEILNSVGQLVKQYPVKVANGYNEVKIPINDIKSGIYVLKINREGVRLIRRFVIAR